eukprot:TRINITY_DN19564_c0_g1_i1.p1 TRINITY_DN19564_c0_g1~~TRINITY_DN19564_c0_g1_i1.p1  ORF type:complete len:372 (+),score=103.50 TRINITY_DN19564_c0_g1_i1:66-1118(+)
MVQCASDAGGSAGDRYSPSPDGSAPPPDPLPQGAAGGAAGWGGCPGCALYERQIADLKAAALRDIARRAEERAEWQRQLAAQEAELRQLRMWATPQPPRRRSVEADSERRTAAAGGSHPVYYTQLHAPCGGRGGGGGAAQAAPQRQPSQSARNGSDEALSAAPSLASPPRRGAPAAAAWSEAAAEVDELRAELAAARNRELHLFALLQQRTRPQKTHPPPPRCAQQPAPVLPPPELLPPHVKGALRSAALWSRSRSLSARRRPPLSSPPPRRPGSRRAPRPTAKMRGAWQLPLCRHPLLGAVGFIDTAAYVAVPPPGRRSAARQRSGRPAARAPAARLRTLPAPPGHVRP